MIIVLTGFTCCFYAVTLRPNLKDTPMVTKVKMNTAQIFPKETEGETISELVRRHLMDENHTTTDEELQNVKLKIYSSEGVEGVY